MIGVLGIAGASLAMWTSVSDKGVAISGAVLRPGVAPISRVQSLNEAVGKLGGFALNADRRHVRVISADGVEKVVDTAQLGIIHAVRPGDRVVVPAIDPTKSVLVQGGVDRAGAYDFRPGMTVRDLVGEANPSKIAALDKIKVYRPDKNGTVQIHTANLLAMHANGEALRAGDTVYVPRASAAMSDRELLTIAIIGLVIIVLFN